MHGCTNNTVLVNINNLVNFGYKIYDVDVLRIYKGSFNRIKLEKHLLQK